MTAGGPGPCWIFRPTPVTDQIAYRASECGRTFSISGAEWKSAPLICKNAGRAARYWQVSTVDLAANRVTTRRTTGMRRAVQ